MMTPRAHAGTLSVFDPATAALVRLSACITAGSEEAVRTALEQCQAVPVPDMWIEELVLQSYLFAGFPRALNAARAWRRRAGSAVPEPNSASEHG